MSKISSAIPILIALAIGVLVGRFLIPPLETKEPTESSGLEQQVHSLSALEISEYQKLKTLEEKYNKADEILGKIMAIFVADLGLHINKPQLPKPNETSVAQMQTPTATQAATQSAATTVPEKVPVKSIGGKEKATSAAILAAEKTIGEVRNANDVNEFLNKVKVDNFVSAWSSANRFANTSGNLEMLLGTFRGKAQVVVGGKNHEWQVVLMINGSMVDSVLKGRARVTMTDETGRPFSTQRDGGNIQLLREVTDGSSAIFIRASPDTYFQMYYAAGIGGFIGNVYQGEDQVAPPIGTLELRK